MKLALLNSALPAHCYNVLDALLSIIQVYYINIYINTF